ncbi:hypothetical protein DKX38_001933 [Salix brachista]|uniref:Uncharacterized protein n=1 Tax=Salix brachista TaxID=2182728 RepID=A0A5N5NKM6_9ROSI|nr:hypothetical protein DKX38_001933 [Salix brachista]
MPKGSVAAEQNVKKRERKVCDFSGPKRDPLEERDPLKIFYETLFEQIPDSEMAQFWSYEKIVDYLWCLQCNHIMNCVESVAFANTNTSISLVMLMESGLLPMEVARKVYDKKQKRN